MKPCNKKPCNECPYLKSSVNHYLGGNTLKTYSLPIKLDIEHPCHLTMGKETERYCAGLASVRINSFKSARKDGVIRQSEEIMREQLDHRVACFQNREAFEFHHKNANQYIVNTDSRFYVEMQVGKLRKGQCFHLKGKRSASPKTFFCHRMRSSLKVLPSS